MKPAGFLRLLIGVGVMLGSGGAFAEPTPQTTLDPQISATLARMIRSFQFNCPAAKTASEEKKGQYGRVLHVFCGPAGKNGVYSNAGFRVTFRDDDRFTVEPWR